MYTNVRISDSAVTNEAYARRAQELGHTVLSSCEHGWQGNVWDVYKLSQQYKLKFLASAEAYWVKDRTQKDNTNSHVFIGAKNEHGRQAMNDVLSEANITGFYGRPRLDVPLLLSLPKDDVWITTACIAYWKYDDIEDITKTLSEHFGKNFFLEVQYHNTESQAALNSRIIKLHDSLKIPLIMGCDSHYIYPAEGQNRTDFLESKGLTYPDEEGWYLDYPDGKVAYERFAKQAILSHEQIEEAMSNTLIFQDVEVYDSPIFNTNIKMPSIHPEWTQEQKDDEYKRLVWSGWDAYKECVPVDKHGLYEAEIQGEIDTVVETHMADYFIDNYHIIRQGKKNGGQLTKTGRGSAVSFITNKLLGFTEVDRVAASVKMYPERFMSAARILTAGTLPDIDFNVADQEPFAKAQQQVLGEDHAYPMVAYQTLKTSAAWKLYAKSQGVPFELANVVSGQLKRYEEAYKQADEDAKADMDVLDYIEPQYHEIFQKSGDYLGLISSWSIAPCSYLLYQGNIRKEIGLVMVKDHLCCCLDGHWAENAHFLKNDLLTVQVVNLMYQAYQRAGVALPSVEELLQWCSDDPAAWQLYEKGCTLCLNQVEQPGTSARVGQYKPSNISELCAFVAAIRPGFKSMYKTFESRVPFSYGVKAFDDLIQTPEMPNSFVLYQEMEMAALHYAGIPMSDTYTAVKNIAKKRVEKVLAYKETFISGFKNSILQEGGKTDEEAAALADKLWQIIEDSARYSFNASHSYCVALDSLYGAWLKSHYPLEFYETAIRIYEKKGNKDKMAVLKEEAERYFDIQFPPFRYGQDNRSIHGDPNTNTIVNSMRSIKGFGQSVGQCLWRGFSEIGDARFMAVLQWFDQHGLKESKLVPLIKIDYFQQFGNNAELLRLVDIFSYFKQGTAKSISKEKLNADMEAFVARHGTDKGKNGNTLKSYTITDMEGLLAELEEYIMSLNLPELPYRVKAQNQLDILGYVDLTTHKEDDRRKLYILDRIDLRSRFHDDKHVWKVNLKTKSIGSGKTASLSVSPQLMKAKPVNKGDIVYAKRLYQDKKGYWNLLDYDVLIS